MSEPKQLLVGQDNNTQTEMGESGTASASVGTSAQTLESQTKQTQTVKGESGVASAGVGNEVRVLSKTEERKGSNKYIKEDNSAIQNTEARILESHEENQTVYGGSRSGDIEVEKRVLGSLERMVGINLGQSVAINETSSKSKKNVVDTILVKEVKRLIKKAIKEAEIGGGGSGGNVVINIDGGITEEIAHYIAENPGTMIQYENYIYVPTSYDQVASYIYYASLAADEEVLYYLIINLEVPEIDGEGSFPLITEYIFTVRNPQHVESEDNINRVIRKRENDGSIKETYVIDKIVKESTLVTAMADTEDYENGEDVDFGNTSLNDIYGGNIDTIFGDGCGISDAGSNYAINYNQDGTKTYGIRFGENNFDNYGTLSLDGCIPNKVIRVIVGKYFEYDEQGNKVFDEHCAIYSDNFTNEQGEIVGGGSQEITEERQVFELKTDDNGNFYFDSDGEELGFGNTRFILYGFEIGEPESVEYKARQIDLPCYPEVEIERVWLTYDDRKSIRSDVLGTLVQIDGGSQLFVNDSTHIWYNFKTTPISPIDEQAIKDGKFIIRLDYPCKNRSRIMTSENVISHQSTTKNGVGTRSFAPNFLGNNVSMSPNKKQVLLNSLIFISPSDIKTNALGQKYIHKKVSFFDYVNNMCMCDGSSNNLSPITNANINIGGSDDNNIFEDYLLGTFSIGIPSLYQNSCEIRSLAGNHLFIGRATNKFHTNYRSDYSGSYEVESTTNKTVRTNSVKLNPAFSCYCVLKYNEGDGGEATIYSPYFIDYNKKSYTYFAFQMRYVMGDSNDVEPSGKKVTRKAYMSARPRCCILNDNYETAEEAFVHKYPQSPQQIKLMCKAMVDCDDYNAYALPIFRTIITQK